MELIICEDEDHFVRAISVWCKTQIQQLNARSVFIPAGKTPECIYRFWEKSKPDYLNNLELLQVDDVLTGDSQFLFRRFLESSLPSYERKFRWINDGSCIGDLAILGLGLNGHVAFHEPGLNQSLFSGCVKLNAETCHSLGISDGSWGITYGLAAFNRSKGVLLIVRGAPKRQVLSRLLKGDHALPASQLLKHPNLTIIADRDAYG
jgi:6-phosphogluconolactonase/glucosamine-6-phosphate isomerase/deaminase